MCNKGNTEIVTETPILDKVSDGGPMNDANMAEDLHAKLEIRLSNREEYFKIIFCPKIKIFSSLLFLS